MLSEGRVDAIYSEVGVDRDDTGHTYFCSLLGYLQRVDFQFFGLYDLGGLKYLAHETEPCCPWANALFLRNGLVQAKYGYDYARWLAGFARP